VLGAAYVRITIICPGCVELGRIMTRNIRAKKGIESIRATEMADFLLDICTLDDSTHMFFMP
jgi:hypothetical protein